MIRLAAAPDSKTVNGYSFFASFKQECLNHFVAFGETHLRHILSEYLIYYLRFRPHQGLDNRPLNGEESPRRGEDLLVGKILCEERLGGLLRHYRRAA